MNEQLQPDLVILHAGWLDQRLALWGEVLQDAVPSPTEAAAKPGKMTTPAPPKSRGSAAPSFGLPAAMLESLLRESVPDVVPAGVRLISVMAWLPTMRGRPLPSDLTPQSPSLVKGRGRRGAPAGEPESGVAALAPWSVEALALEVDAALFLLGQGDEGSLLAPGLALGSDLRFWRAAMRLAAALTVRQAFVPGVQVEGERYAARWQPFIAGQDEARLAQLAGGMPAACRALSLESAGPNGRVGALPPNLPERAVVAEFVAAVVDALVRGGAGTAAMAVGPGVAVEQVASDSLHAQWLAALRAPDARMAGDAKELASFAAQVRSWAQPLSLTEDPSVRLCFRLEEPALSAAGDMDGDMDGDLDGDLHGGLNGVGGMDDAWRVQYLLQATDDPSLLVPAETIWHASRTRHRGGELAATLERSIAMPREKLLAALGRAAPLSTAIEASLRAAEPAGYALDSAGAHAFLTETAWLLESAGFGVLLPAWWTRTGTKLRLAGRAKIKSPKLSGGGMSLDTLVAVDWQLALGDKSLTPEELEALAQLKTPLVRIRGQWVEVSARQITDALAFWRRRGVEHMPLGHAMRLALGAEGTGNGLAVTSVTSDGWVADLLARLEGRATLEPVPPPAALRGALRPYQERGYAWLHFLSRWGLGACLADDMGLGKAQPLDAGVLTPSGWKRMGDIRVGDAVVNSRGGTAHVTGVYPQGERDIYRVEFTDGSSTECCDEHLWYVNTPLRRSRGAVGRVLQLTKIHENLKDSVGNNQHFIPLVQPIEFEEVALPLDPYLLGVLLGDGGIKYRIIVSSYDDAILDRVRTSLPQGVELKRKGACDWRIAGKFAGGANPIMDALRHLGLMGTGSQTKFIPDVYRFSSSSARLELLRGLMDTDGYIGSNVLGFSSVSLQLTRDVQFIVQSLGGVARFQQRRTTWTHNGEKKEGVAYRLTIAMPGDMNPFHLKRKADLCKRREKYSPVRAFKSITYIGRKAAQCIAVDSPDRLYVTDECILTHNTVQTLALLQRDWSEGVRRPVLLICPTSVIENWRKEAARFTPELPVLIHHGASRRKAEAFAEEVAGYALVISSYALLHRDAELLRSVTWRGVVLDEAQNIKNPETRQARAARALSADYRAALTGTPVENHVGDLWSLMETLNPGLLGSQADFKRRFFVPIQVERDETAAAQLKRLTGPFILRRLKTDRAIIADLPDKLEMKVFCTLTQEQASLYAAVLKDLDEPLEEAHGIQRKGLILATLTKLKQICNHPAQFLGDGSAVAGRSGKLARLEEMLEEVLATGDRALIFSQFAEMGELLRRHLQRTFGREALFLHGGVPRARRDRMVERFQSAPSAADGPAIFILSLKAGGTGLNLTAASHVFHFDRWWNPAVENQATDRAYRIGQRQAVQVHKFICAGTLEERIDAMIESKQDVAARVVGTGEGWLTELSTAQLRDLLALRAEAVQD